VQGCQDRSRGSFLVLAAQLLDIQVDPSCGAVIAEVDTGDVEAAPDGALKDGEGPGQRRHAGLGFVVFSDRAGGKGQDQPLARTECDAGFLEAGLDGVPCGS
jgi:hypothetical protein